MPQKVLMKTSCRGCGSNDHKTPCCPNKPCLCCGEYHRRGIQDCPITQAALSRHKALQKAAVSAAKAAARQQAMAAKTAKNTVQLAVFESLLPFGVDIKNSTMFTDGNWAIEAVSFCPRCEKPEPKNGCWCMQFK
jgi:hypothetical protein